MAPGAAVAQARLAFLDTTGVATAAIKVVTERGTETGFDLSGNLDVSRSTKNEPPAGNLGGDARGDFNEALREPTFGRSVFGAGIQSDERPGAFSEEFAQRGHFARGDPHSWCNEIAVGAEVTGEVEIPVGLVADGGEVFDLKLCSVDGQGFVDRLFAGGFVDGVGEEGTSPVAGKADAAWNAGAETVPSGPEGIRKDDGEVVGVPAQGDGGADDFVDVGVVLPEFGEFAGAGDGEPGVGVEFVEALDGRQGHDGVANPVGGADEDALGFGVNDGRWFGRRHRSLSLQK